MSIVEIIKSIKEWHSTKVQHDLEEKLNALEDGVARQHYLSSGDYLIKDNNRIGDMLLITFILRTLKLFMFILSFSFFSAMLFRIVLTLENDLWKG